MCIATTIRYKVVVEFLIVIDRNIGPWNAMIIGYVQTKYEKDALMLFIEMEAVMGLYPNTTTMASIMSAMKHLVTNKKFMGMS